MRFDEPPLPKSLSSQVEPVRDDGAGNGVAAEDFRRLLARLDPDPQLAWEAYERLRGRLIRYFEHKQCFGAPELADEVLDRIARKPDSYEIPNVLQFCFGVARKVRAEMLEKTSRRQPLSDENEPAQGHAEDWMIEKLDREQKIQCFLSCMGRLKTNERALILNYYPLEGDNIEERRQELAQTLGVSYGSLRTKVARLKERIERCFQNCIHRKRVHCAPGVKKRGSNHV